ncbi:OmpA family protein [Paraliomyxa miuraensis]|uniref:OmpA family protein n=1 Tax=Paraliomyxa miuraensis TaxID=376150 RepID=UPI002251CC6D|nr:OmpA family protein [Paraliomyxa miuraensis]MCX4246638.1 OmpA family protein [Paraliomyxa miuraensis]
MSAPSPNVTLSLALGVGLCLGLAPRAALAEPDEDDLSLDDEEEEDPLDDEGEEQPLDDEEAPGASGGASGSASVSLGGGASAKGEGKGKGKKQKAPKQKDDRPFIKRYSPQNHMINAGAYLGAFWRADNHGLFDRSLGDRPDTQRTNFDVGFRLEYMPIPYIGVGFEGGAMPTNSTSIMGGAKGNFYAVRGHVIGALPYRITPTLAVGGGLVGLRSNEPILNGADPAFHWGPGAKFFINEWIAVRVDGRHMVSSRIEGNRVHHGELLFGAEVTIRLTKWVGAKWRSQRTDTDGDEIADYWDECPKEWGDGENGCPLDRDTDRDGIKDKHDRCPNEWGDGPDGCPIPDKDGDGILDLDDRCEEQPENYNGIDDEDGCPDEIPEEVKQFEGVLKGIYFDTGKSTIRKKSYPALDRVVKVLEKYPGLKVEISGHTDSVGSEEDNVVLSQERADAVKQFMVDKGIDEGRITTRGAGPNEPIADNKSKKGRQQNRRIEFRLQ